MDLTFNFDDVESAFQEYERQVLNAMDKVGREAVEYARERGTYHDVTGNLRRSNEYQVSQEGLTLRNDASYAESVEQRGYDVLSGAALYAEKRLKEEFEA